MNDTALNDFPLDVPFRRSNYSKCDTKPLVIALTAQFRDETLHA